MKKIVSVILMCSLLLICLSGCKNSNNNGDNTEQSSTTTVDTKRLDNESELIKSLARDLRATNGNGLGGQQGLYAQILKIEKKEFGYKPLLVKLDPSSCYYVCGYSNNAFGCSGEKCFVTNERRGESDSFCHAESYTWVKFDEASEIQEYYNGEKFVAAFQLNPSLEVTNILSVDEEVPDFEYFRRYIPEFKEGLNVEPAIALREGEEGYIYVTRSDDKIIYCEYESSSITPCIQIEGQYYIKYLFDIGTDGLNIEEDISVLLGEYYDGLRNVIDTQKFDRYGVILIEDFANFLNELIKE